MQIMCFFVLDIFKYRYIFMMRTFDGLRKWSDTFELVSLTSDISEPVCDVRLYRASS